MEQLLRGEVVHKCLEAQRETAGISAQISLIMVSLEPSTWVVVELCTEEEAVVDIMVVEGAAFIVGMLQREEVAQAMSAAASLALVTHTQEPQHSVPVLLFRPTTVMEAT